MTFFPRMEYLSKNENILYYSFECYKNILGEKHGFECCDCTCAKINFLLPIIEEFKKDISKEEKEAFFILRCFEFPCF